MPPVRRQNIKPAKPNKPEKRKAFEPELADFQCGCDVPAVKSVVKNGNNQGRSFFRCPNAHQLSDKSWFNGCKLFVWEEEATPEKICPCGKIGLYEKWHKEEEDRFWTCRSKNQCGYLDPESNTWKSFE